MGRLKKIKHLNKILSYIIIIVLVSCVNQRNEDSEINKKVGVLLKKMTLEEKVGQMINIGLPAILEGNNYWKYRDTAIIDTAKLALFIGKYGVGSIHNTPGYPPDKEEWYRIIKQIQDYAINNTRLGIPIIYGIDGVHGANYVNHSTLLPQQIALAATWNTDLVKKAGEITAYEISAASLLLNYAPVLDIAPQPLWGRMFESFGEDPYLVSQMTNAYIIGAQGKNMADPTKVAVCLKHYLGYGAAINGKDRASAFIPENYLRQYYLPPFQNAIEKGALSVMLSSNTINGIPCHINKYYITDILKNELGFKGFTLSDFSDVEFLVTAHRVAENKKEATKMAVNAGLDMIMNPYNADISEYLIELVNEGEVSINRINDAVRRILYIKFKLGLFENPYFNPDSYTNFASEEFIENNYNASKECITLLKNNEILPLPKNRKLLVTGPAANSINYLNGAWSRSFQGLDTSYNDPSKLNILNALINETGEDKIKYVEGTKYEINVNINKAVKNARDVDYIVACLGEIPATEKPSDINELPLPQIQIELIKELKKTNKPIILVLVEGRPRIIKEIVPLVDAIILAYLPGDEGGRVIADVLVGKVNPSGKLPYTYPKYTGNLLTYMHKKADIRDKSWNFNGFYPQYEFGYGLSYTNYLYDNFSISADTLYGNDSLSISVRVSNIGKIAGKEVIEVYIKDHVASIAPDVKKLVRFTKVHLDKGESKIVSFNINKTDLGFIGLDNKWIVENGKFSILIGGNPRKLLQKDFQYIE